MRLRHACRCATVQNEVGKEGEALEEEAEGVNNMGGMFGGGDGGGGDDSGWAVGGEVIGMTREGVVGG